MIFGFSFLLCLFLFGVLGRLLLGVCFVLFLGLFVCLACRVGFRVLLGW